MDITTLDIERNKEEILSILKSVLNDEDYDNFTKYLLSTDFFTAPYTTQFQYSNVGGLAQYSLLVYKTLGDLAMVYETNYDAYTLAILGLFHAISKAEYFEEYIKNEKVYSPNGAKRDEIGNFDWFATKQYKVKDAAKRYVAGNLGVTSYMLLSRYLPLTEESIMALMYYTYDDSTKDIYELLKRYPLIALLHCASTIVLNVIKE